MAQRTLSSTWKQFERIFKRHADGVTTESEHIAALSDLCQKVNNSGIVGALATLLVHKYGPIEDSRVEFVTADENGFPDWVTAYDLEGKTLKVNPVGVFEFIKTCHDAVDQANTPEGRLSFQKYRHTAYLAELSKLPPIYLLFIQIIKEIGRAVRIVRVEKKGGGIEEVEDEDYMILLWAYKELEGYFHDNNGRSLRSEFALRWYESDWISGK